MTCINVHAESRRYDAAHNNKPGGHPMYDQNVWTSDDVAESLLLTAVTALIIGLIIGAAVGGILGAIVF
jgi:hypothetical protein